MQLPFHVFSHDREVLLAMMISNKIAHVRICSLFRAISFKSLQRFLDQPSQPVGETNIVSSPWIRLFYRLGDR